MNVAVCISGLTYPDSDDLVKRLRKRFPNFDFFYGVWKGRECDISRSLNAFSFDEPEVTYHPYLDIDINTFPPKIKDIVEKMHRKMKAKEQMDMITKAPHQTKQILMHSYILNEIPAKYDLIIRCRWDLLIKDPSIPFEKFIEESYNENKAIGFSRKLSKDDRSYWNAKGTHRHNWWEGFLMDLMIIHPRALFQHDKMQKLHNDKLLLAAEFGWYQVLSKEDNHDCYFAKINMTSRDGYR